VPHGAPLPPDESEPRRIAAAIAALKLSHAVITSVTRDDLPGGGASFFASAILETRKAAPKCAVEVLVPDFSLRMEKAIDEIAAARPDVLNHNIEAAAPVYGAVRPMGDYAFSLCLLKRAAGLGLVVKSGLMAGFGESMADITQTLEELRDTGCSFVTIGQYLTSKRGGLPVKKYYHPDEFEAIKERALALGFTGAEAGVNVRSSYRAAELFRNT
jgi:lipoic acid synthetase